MATRFQVTRAGARRAARGFSLIELMTSITIGLLILAGLASVFVNSSNANREMRNTSEQLENGRYAVELLTQEIRHAGFYGELSALPTVPAAAPDPCTLPTAGTVTNTVNASLALPVQRVSSAAIPANCATLLTSANLQPNSDIIVVRRTDTTMVNSAGSGTIVGGTYYLQTTADTASIQVGVAGAITSAQDATQSTSTLQRRDFTVAASGTPAQFPLIAAAIRTYHVRIYFVAPCSVPNGGGSVCTGSADDLGKPIPTLKRLELDSTGAFSITPLVEGIQAIRFEYGVDSLPATADSGTGLIGDSVPDSFPNVPSVAEMGNTVAMRIFVLARNSATSSGYVDNKTYAMGSNPVYTYTPSGAETAYKRHVYASETRIVNQAGRREIPQ